MPLTTRLPVGSYRRSRVAVRLVGWLVGDVVPLGLPDGAVVDVHEVVGPSVPLVVDEVDVVLVLVVEVLEVVEGSLAHVVLVGLDVVDVDVDGSLVVLVDEVGEDVGDPLVLVVLVEEVGVPVVLVEPDDVEVVLLVGREVVEVVGRDVVVLDVGWLVSAAGIPGVTTVLHGWCGDPGVTGEVLSRTDCVPSR